MPRPRRKPAPPGRVHVVCTCRDPEQERRHIKTLQMRRLDDGIIRFTWAGPAPETGYRWSDGSHTFEFRCGRCPRHMKVHEDRLVLIAHALAEQQGTHGETPIVVDISRIERAL